MFASGGLVQHAQQEKLRYQSRWILGLLLFRKKRKCKSRQQHSLLPNTFLNDSQCPTTPDPSVVQYAA